MIDTMDSSILAILQEDARISNAELARRVGMAPSAVFERIRKLEERGVIRGYSAAVDPALLGLGLLAYVFVRGDETQGTPALEKALAAIRKCRRSTTSPARIAS